MLYVGFKELLSAAAESAEGHCGAGARETAQTNTDHSGSIGHDRRPCQGCGDGAYWERYLMEKNTELIIVTELCFSNGNKKLCQII